MGEPQCTFPPPLPPSLPSEASSLVCKKEGRRTEHDRDLLSRQTEGERGGERAGDMMHLNILLGRERSERATDTAATRARPPPP